MWWETPTEDPSADRGLLGDPEVQSVLLGIWQDVLGVPVKASDSFFDLNGDSFTAMRALSLIRAQLGCAISIVDLFDYPSVEELAPLVQQSLVGDQHVNPETQ